MVRAMIAFSFNMEERTFNITPRACLKKIYCALISDIFMHLFENVPRDTSALVLFQSPFSFFAFSCVPGTLSPWEFAYFYHLLVLHRVSLGYFCACLSANSIRNIYIPKDFSRKRQDNTTENYLLPCEREVDIAKKEHRQTCRVGEYTWEKRTIWFDIGSFKQVAGNVGREKKKQKLWQDTNTDVMKGRGRIRCSRDVILSLSPRSSPERNRIVFLGCPFSILPSQQILCIWRFLIYSNIVGSVFLQGL